MAAVRAQTAAKQCYQHVPLPDGSSTTPSAELCISNGSLVSVTIQENS